MTEFELVLSVMNEDQIADLYKSVVIERNASNVYGTEYAGLARAIEEYVCEHYETECLP